MEEFRNIGIIGRLNSNKVIDTIRRLSRYLLDEGYHTILDDRIAEVMPGHGMQVCNVSMLGEICDMVIVVGGANGGGWWWSVVLMACAARKVKRSKNQLACE